MILIKKGKLMFKKFMLFAVISLVAIVSLWSLEGDDILSDSFEAYPDFAHYFGSWTLRDIDSCPTFGFHDYYFFSSGSPMAFIVFNPSMTTPPLTQEYNLPLDGDKFIVSFCATVPPNDDWLITPTLALDDDASISFFARSQTEVYGLERFNVLVSFGSTNPEDFICISGDSYIEAPTAWTEYSYDLNAYSGQTIRVAVQCVSSYAFMFMIDNFKVTAPNGTGNGTDASAATTELVGNYPNPFNPETTISYKLRKAGHVTLDIFNIKGQKVNSLVNKKQVQGNHTVIWNGRDDNNRAVASGVYFYKMRSGFFSSTKKMILMK